MEGIGWESVPETLSLFHVEVDGWVLMMKAALDFDYRGEPWPSLMLLLNPENGHCYSKCLGQTVHEFYFKTDYDFEAHCEVFFRETYRSRKTSSEGESRNLVTLANQSLNFEIVSGEIEMESASPTLARDDLAPEDVKAEVSFDEVAEDELDEMLEPKNAVDLRIGVLPTPEEVEENKTEVVLKQEAVENEAMDISEAFTPSAEAKKDAPEVEAQEEDEPLTMPRKVYHYKCKMCENSYPTRTGLEMHMEHYHKVDPYNCEKCEKSFKVHSGLLAHQERTHGHVRFDCAECEEDFMSPEVYAAHVRSKHPGKFPVCAECDQEFAASSSADPTSEFASHVIDCLRKSRVECRSTASGQSKTKKKRRAQSMATKSRPVTCELCGEFFKYRQRFERHMIRVHTGAYPYNCDKCDFKTADKGHMKYHELGHLRIELKESGATVAPDGTPLYYFCSKCPKRFTRESDIKEHDERAHQGKKHACAHCDFVCATRPCLLNHVAKAHSDDPRHKCPHCDYRGAKARMTVHMRSHAAAGAFTCGTCGKQLKSKCSLRGHMRTHTGERPCKCPLCDYSAKTHSALSQHKRDVHNAGKALKEHKIVGAVPPQRVDDEGEEDESV